MENDLLEACKKGMKKVGERVDEKVNIEPMTERVKY